MPALYPMRLCRTVKSCSYKETQRKCLEELYVQMGRAGEEVFFFIHAHCVGSSRWKSEFYSDPHPEFVWSANSCSPDVSEKGK